MNLSMETLFVLVSGSQMVVQKLEVSTANKIWICFTIGSKQTRKFSFRTIKNESFNYCTGFLQVLSALGETASSKTYLSPTRKKY